VNESEARSFDRTSDRHYAILAFEAAARGCQCEAYRDWYTYKRWRAQGMQVQKGEKSFKLPTFYTVKEVDKSGKEVPITRRSTSCLFCRCQVKEVTK